MSFVRVKRINGGEYAYLVENSWTAKGARQKVGAYLGKVYKPTRVKSEGLSSFINQDMAKFIEKSSFNLIAEKLVILELQNHDVKSEEVYIDFDQGMVKDKRQKNVVFALNNGHLCTHSLKKLINYNPQEDYSGYKLADSLTAAGIFPEQEVFIEIFGKFKSIYEENAQKNQEFYY